MLVATDLENADDINYAWTDVICDVHIIYDEIENMLAHDEDISEDDRIMIENIRSRVNRIIDLM